MNSTGPGTVERRVILVGVMAVTFAPVAIAVIAGVVTGNIIAGVAVFLAEIAVIGLVIKGRRRLVSASR